MGITLANHHKRFKTGAKKQKFRKKKKYELGRPSANTKIGPTRKRIVRTRGGNYKIRALRLDAGSFAWGSETITRKTRILDVVYNASNNELVRTKTLVKNAIVVVDATPFRQWYESFYITPLGRKKGTKAEQETAEQLETKLKDSTVKAQFLARQKRSPVESALEEQFMQGKLLACIASRPGQIGQADGYILEGRELEFYLRKIKTKKAK